MTESEGLKVMTYLRLALPRQEISEGTVAVYCDALKTVSYGAVMAAARTHVATSAWCGIWLEAARQKVRPGGLVGVFTDWRQLPSVTDAIQVGGWIWRGILGWDKTEGVRPQLGRFRQQLEFVVWGSNGPLPSAGRVAPGCYRASRDDESKEHATGKPVGVMQWLLSLLEPGSLVLDPFAGSGSTGVACLRRGLRFIGFELSPQIAVLASERLAAESGAVDRDGVQMSMLEALS